jgi:hypothetical protein
LHPASRGSGWQRQAKRKVLLKAWIEEKAFYFCTPLQQEAVGDKGKAKEKTKFLSKACESRKASYLCNPERNDARQA